MIAYNITCFHRRADIHKTSVKSEFVMFGFGHRYITEIITLGKQIFYQKI